MRREDHWRLPVWPTHSPQSPRAVAVPPPDTRASPWIQRHGSPPDIYVSLQVAQSLSVQTGSLKNDVNTIYVAAASAADISAVSSEIATLLPHATVTTAASLASEVTGSVSSAAKLAGDLGRWLSVLVLIAAFAVACLLTMAAVARRVAEFGTLKAIGWRTRRIVVQVFGESVVMGIVGAVVGVGLGFAGAAIITKVAPKLSATVGGSRLALAASTRAAAVTAEAGSCTYGTCSGSSADEPALSPPGGPSADSVIVLFPWKCLFPLAHR
jgi:ABC-type antimicrobial peptide transport system permease subunit